jgi:drug/metabolite transporter (DMT)-like permease
MPVLAPQDDLALLHRRAVAASLVASGLFAVMAMGVRAVAVRIPGPQIAFVRFATGLAVVILLAALRQIDVRPRRWGWLTARGVAGGLAVVAYFVCIERVGVGIATLLNHTGPVWSLVFAWLLLGEKPRARALVALSLTMAGVFLVAGKGTSLRIGLWELVGIFSAVTTGIAVTSIRAVRRPGVDGAPVEGSWTVFFSFTALGLVSTLPWVIGRWVAPTAREWALLFAAAFISIAAQLAMTRALAFMTAVASGIVMEFTVVLSMLGGLALFGETLSLRTGLGSLVTMVGVMWMVLAGTSRPAARSAGRAP